MTKEQLNKETIEKSFDKEILRYSYLASAHEENELVIKASRVLEIFSEMNLIEKVIDDLVGEEEKITYEKGIEKCEQTGNTKDMVDHKFHCHYKKGYNTCFEDVLTKAKEKGLLNK